MHIPNDFRHVNSKKNLLSTISNIHYYYCQSMTTISSQKTMYTASTSLCEKELPLSHKFLKTTLKKEKMMLGGKHSINYRSNVHMSTPDFFKPTKSSGTTIFLYKRTPSLYRSVWLTTTMKYVYLAVAALH